MTANQRIWEKKVGLFIRVQQLAYMIQKRVPLFAESRDKIYYLRRSKLQVNRYRANDTDTSTEITASLNA